MYNVIINIKKNYFKRLISLITSLIYINIITRLYVYMYMYIIAYVHYCLTKNSNLIIIKKYLNINMLYTYTLHRTYFSKYYLLKYVLLPYKILLIKIIFILKITFLNKYLKFSNNLFYYHKINKKLRTYYYKKIYYLTLPLFAKYWQIFLTIKQIMVLLFWLSLLTLCLFFGELLFFELIGCVFNIVGIIQVVGNTVGVEIRTIYLAFDYMSYLAVNYPEWFQNFLEDRTLAQSILSSLTRFTFLQNLFAWFGKIVLCYVNLFWSQMFYWVWVLDNSALGVCGAFGDNVLASSDEFFWFTQNLGFCAIVDGLWHLNFTISGLLGTFAEFFEELWQLTAKAIAAFLCFSGFTGIFFCIFSSLINFIGVYSLLELFLLWGVIADTWTLIYSWGATFWLSFLFWFSLVVWNLRELVDILFVFWVYFFVDWAQAVGIAWVGFERAFFIHLIAVLNLPVRAECYGFPQLSQAVYYYLWQTYGVAVLLPYATGVWVGFATLPDLASNLLIAGYVAVRAIVKFLAVQFNVLLVFSAGMVVIGFDLMFGIWAFNFEPQAAMWAALLIIFQDFTGGIVAGLPFTATAYYLLVVGFFGWSVIVFSRLDRDRSAARRSCVARIDGLTTSASGLEKMHAAYCRLLDKQLGLFQVLSVNVVASCAQRHKKTWVILAPVIPRTMYLNINSFQFFGAAVAFEKFFFFNRVLKFFWFYKLWGTRPFLTLLAQLKRGGFEKLIQTKSIDLVCSINLWVLTPLVRLYFQLIRCIFQFNVLRGAGSQEFMVGVEYRTNYAFRYLSVLLSLPFFLIFTFLDLFFWITSTSTAYFQSLLSDDSVAYGVAPFTRYSFNTKFLREFDDTTLRLSSKVFAPDELAVKYFLLIDSRRPVFAADNSGLNRFKFFPNLYGPGLLTDIGAQFFKHTLFGAVFARYYYDYVLYYGEGPADARFLTYSYSLIESFLPVTTYMWISSVIKLASTPLLYLVSFVVYPAVLISHENTLVEHRGLPTSERFLTTGSDILNVELTFLRFLVINTFLDPLAVVEGRRDRTRRSWMSNPLLQWRWGYRRFNRLRDYFQQLNHVPRRKWKRAHRSLNREPLYTLNPYQIFEQLPDFTLPSPIFVDDHALSRGPIWGGAEDAPDSLMRPILRRHPVQTRALDKMQSYRGARRKLNRGAMGGEKMNFVIPEKNYFNFFQEGYVPGMGNTSSWLARRYNFFFSELVGLEQTSKLLNGVGVWSIQFTPYDHYLKWFYYRYWGSKQAYYLKFLSYEKFQFFKRRKLRRVRRKFKRLAAWKREVHDSEEMLWHFNVYKRDRLTRRLAYFFLTISGKDFSQLFDNSLGTRERTVAATAELSASIFWNLLYPALFDFPIFIAATTNSLVVVNAAIYQILQIFSFFFYTNLSAYYLLPWHIFFNLLIRLFSDAGVAFNNKLPDPLQRHTVFFVISGYTIFSENFAVDVKCVHVLK